MAIIQEAIFPEEKKEARVIAPKEKEKGAEVKAEAPKKKGK